MFGWPESFHFILGNVTETLSWPQGPDPGRYLQPKEESDLFPSSFDRALWVSEAELNTPRWGKSEKPPQRRPAGQRESLEEGQPKHG